jgi:hypothetical protein
MGIEKAIVTRVPSHPSSTIVGSAKHASAVRLEMLRQYRKLAGMRLDQRALPWDSQVRDFTSCW